MSAALLVHFVVVGAPNKRNSRPKSPLLSRCGVGSEVSV